MVAGGMWLAGWYVPFPIKKWICPEYMCWVLIEEAIMQVAVGKNFSE